MRSRKSQLAKVSLLLLFFCFIFPRGDIFQSSRLIRYCWNYENWATFDGCVFNNTVMWEPSSIPLRMNCDAPNQEACVAATEEMERVVGCNLFDLDASTDEADIILRNQIHYDDYSVIATTAFKRVNFNSFRAHIGIHLTFFIDNTLQTTIMHELGHALGLEHNADDPNQIMYPWLSHNTVSFSEEDVELLRELYCR